jgi:hypothetical protein
MLPASSSPLPIHTKDKHKETVPNVPALELGSVQRPQGKADGNTFLNAITENSAMMVSSSTSITAEKKVDRMPVLADQLSTLVKVEEEEQYIIPVSKKFNESNLPRLSTPTLTSISLEETGSTSTNPISIYSDQNNQITYRNEGQTEKTENVNSNLDYYSNPFLASWQVSLAIYNEFAVMGIRLSLNWFEYVWKALIPTTMKTGNLNNKLGTDQEVP